MLVVIVSNLLAVPEYDSKMNMVTLPSKYNRVEGFAVGQEDLVGFFIGHIIPDGNLTFVDTATNEQLTVEIEYSDDLSGSKGNLYLYEVTNDNAIISFFKRATYLVYVYRDPKGDVDEGVGGDALNLMGFTKEYYKIIDE